MRTTLVRGRKRRKRREAPRARFEAGDPRSIELVRGYIAAERRRRDQSLDMAEEALARLRVEPRRRLL